MRREIAPLLAVHALSRAVLTVLAVADAYPFGFGVKVHGDVFLYDRYADAIVGGALPYVDVAIEYPPGVLPALLLPQLAGGDPLRYRLAFVLLCALLDGAVMVALLLLGRRTGSGRAGAWLWTLGVPLLGPIALLRLDLIPTVAAVWAVERASARRWGTAGALLGFGAAAKVFPGLLALPTLAAALTAPPRDGTRLPPAARLVVGAVLGGLATTALAGPGVLEMARSVLGYHLERGIQVESVWATPLLAAGRLGAAVTTVEVFGAWHVDAAFAPAVEQVAGVAALVALAVGTWLTVRAARVDAVAGLAAGLCVTLLLLLAVGSVLSPQYLVWALGLGGAALAAGWSRLRGPVLLLLPAALVTQLVFPVLYEELLGLGRKALVALAVRNGLLVGAALWAAYRVWRDTAKRPGQPPAQPELIASSSNQPARGVAS